MGHGFRLMLQLVVTVAAAAVVARATESARRAFEQTSADPPRHRADPRQVRVDPPPPAHLAPHAFGPEPAIPVIELEASGELDGELTPTDRLLALRHASEVATSP